MKLFNSLQRNSILAAGLLLMAGASGAFGQTVIVTPTSRLDFSYQVGTTAPAAQTIRLFASPANLNYTATASTTTGGGWLFLSCSTCGTAPVNNVTQLNGSIGTSGQDLSISVSPAGLVASPTPYTGKITLTSGSYSVDIGVNLVVASTPVLTLSPASVPLQTLERGATFQLPITVGASSGTSAVQFLTSVEANPPNANWIGIQPAGTTGAQYLLTFSAAAFPADLTLGTAVVRFSVFGTNQTVSLPVSFQVTPAAHLQVSQQMLSFVWQPNFTPPGGKPLNVTSSTSTQLTYGAALAANPNYFTLSATSAPAATTSLSGLTTPGSFFVQPNVAALGPNPAPGNYDTPITLTASNGSTATVTARVQVTNQNTLTSSTDFVNFNYTLGGTDITASSITVGSTSQPINFAATAVFDPGVPVFFTVSAPNPFTPQAVVQVAPDMNVIRNLTAGTYSGRVRVQPTGSGTGTLEIPVTLTVSGSAQLTVDTFQPPAFEGPVGASQVQRSLVVRSTDPANPATNFTISVDYGTGPANWLVLNRTTGTTGDPTANIITYNVDPTKITTPGNYTANIVLTPTGVANPVSIRVTIRYNVAGSTTITATPNAVTATQVGSTPPAAATVQLTSSASNVNYLTSVSSVNNDPVFAQVQAGANTIPGSLTITFNSANLAPRTAPYVNTVTVLPSGLPAVPIEVRLTVSAPSTLTVAPAQLGFTFQTGGDVPATQQLTLSSSGAAIAFNVTTTMQAGTSWLQVNPTSGSTNATGGAPVTLTIAANPAGLTAGTYQGTVTITPTTAGVQPVQVPVTLTVSTPNPPNTLQVTNAASSVPRGVSPGEFITIKGRNAAPAVGMLFQLVNGAAPTTLGGVRVLFDGVPAPIIYVGPSGDKTSDQINAIVPYSVSGRAGTNMVVEYRGVQSAAVSLTVQPTEPGIFTANQAGSGPAALLNQDSSANAQNNPAVTGTVIQIFGTGEGLILPTPGDGRVVPVGSSLPTLLNSNVQVRIGGRPAVVQYAGPAPGLIAGVFQINAVIPADLNVTGTVQTALEVTVGSLTSQPAVTFWVRPQQ